MIKILGTCDADDLANGMEFRTDRDFETLREGDTLRISTASGRFYDLHGPEFEGGTPGYAMQPRLWALLMPRLERVEAFRFRIVLTDAQEGIIQGP